MEEDEGARVGGLLPPVRVVVAVVLLEADDAVELADAAGLGEEAAIDQVAPVQELVVNRGLLALDAQLRPLQRIDGDQEDLEDVLLVADAGIVAQLLRVVEPQREGVGHREAREGVGVGGLEVVVVLVEGLEEFGVAVDLDVRGQIRRGLGRAGRMGVSVRGGTGGAGGLGGAVALLLAGRRRGMVVRTAPRLGVVAAVYLQVRRLRLLLVALREMALRPLVVAGGLVLALAPLTLGGMATVEGTGLAVGAGVVELGLGGGSDLARVEALDVLPGVAGLAVDGVPIVVAVVADALDGVRLLVDEVGAVGRIVGRVGRRRGREGRLGRRRDLRGYREGIFGHNLAGASGWQFACEGKRWVVGFSDV